MHLFKDIFQVTSISSQLHHPEGYIHARTHTHLFNGLLSKTTQVSRYQKVKTNLDFTEATGSEQQWHQLGHIQVCTSLQTTMPAPHHSVFLQVGCHSCYPTNSIKALNG